MVRLSGTNTSRSRTVTTVENATANASGSGGSRQRPRARTVSAEGDCDLDPIDREDLALPLREQDRHAEGIERREAGHGDPREPGRRPEPPARDDPEQQRFADRERQAGRGVLGCRCLPQRQPKRVSHQPGRVERCGGKPARTHAPFVLRETGFGRPSR